jgi:hypothetical protein
MLPIRLEQIEFNESIKGDSHGKLCQDQFG